MSEIIANRLSGLTDPEVTTIPRCTKRADNWLISGSLDPDDDPICSGAPEGSVYVKTAGVNSDILQLRAGDWTSIGGGGGSGTVSSTSLYAKAHAYLGGTTDYSGYPNPVGTLNVGDRPVGGCYNPTNNRLYICNFNDGTVSVVDPINKVVVATITVGGNPVHAAFNPAFNTMVVTNYGSSALNVIECSTNTVFTSVGIASTELGRILYIPTDGRFYILARNGGNVKLLVYTAAKTPVSALSITVGPDATIYGLVFIPSVNRVLCISADAAGPYMVNPVNQAVTAMALGYTTLWTAAWCPRDGNVYISNAGGSTLKVVNPAAAGSIGDPYITATISLGGAAYDVLFNPDTGMLYCSMGLLDTIKTVDPKTALVWTPAPSTSGGPTTLIFVPTVSKFYTCCESGDCLSIFQ
jgi:YVTN family beta-propeller protein